MLRKFTTLVSRVMRAFELAKLSWKYGEYSNPTTVKELELMRVLSSPSMILDSSPFIQVSYGTWQELSPNWRLALLRLSQPLSSEWLKDYDSPSTLKSVRTGGR